MHTLDEENEHSNLDICPKCGGFADNGHDREFPPNVYWCKKCTEEFG